MTKPTSSNLEDIINKHEQEHKEQMKDIIKPVELKTFKAYPLIVAVMASLQILTTIYGRHFFYFFGFNVAVGGVVFVPALFYIFQIVAEVYGWQYARQIFWCDFVVNFFTTVSYYLVTYIPYNDFTKPMLKVSYINLIDTMWLSSISWWLGVFLAEYVTSVMMSQSKIWYRGRFIAFRLILLHCFSEVLLFLGLSVSLPYNGYSLDQILHLFMTAFCARTIMSIILLPFVVFIISLLQKRVEKVVAFDNSRNFWNIFHWSIQDKSTVQFDYEQWNRLSAERKKRVDISKIALDYYTDEKLGIDKIFKNKK
jgi:uncharacterized PurR-regulated membrane protein YhhQ (DUF165 family)